MIIRTSEITDTPAIVNLLRLSLGESLVKKSQIVWDFKHKDNPFGPSHVLLAVKDETFVGVRAFMKWNWQLGDKVWVAYRAVDTSTHPSHQGKGIFKKLTLQALKDVQKGQETFIFNTPNDKSRPGYLKMGWVEVASIPIAIVPTLGYFFQSIFSKKRNATHPIAPQKLEELCVAHNGVLSQKNVLFTPKSAAYLKWRFEQNPMQHYEVVSSQDWYVALYIKKHRFFKEVRVVEVIGSGNPSHKREIRSAIANYAIQNRCWIITLAYKELFRLKIYGKFGPKLTFKALTTDAPFINKALAISQWRYSLGDLELF